MILIVIHLLCGIILFLLTFDPFDYSKSYDEYIKSNDFLYLLSLCLLMGIFGFVVYIIEMIISIYYDIVYSLKGKIFVNDLKDCLTRLKLKIKTLIDKISK